MFADIKDRVASVAKALPLAQTAKIGAVAAASVLALCVYNAHRAGKQRKPLTEKVEDELNDVFQAKKDSIAQHLSEALKFKTISYDRPEVAGKPRKKPACALHVHDENCGHDTHGKEPVATSSDPRVLASEAAFLALHAFLQKTYPRMHATLTKHVINKHSLCFVWRGSDPSLQASCLYAHMDVVPVDDEPQWAYPPFDGVIAADASKGGRVYVNGRGAIDDKQAVIGICEAVEHLCATGFKPARTIIISLGHDEEIGGDEGAAFISEWIAENIIVTNKEGKRVKPIAFLLDEGLFCFEGLIPGLPAGARTALIGTGEKGFVNLIMDVEVPGGHASNPPKDTVVGILSRAITKLEANPFPAKFSGPARRMFSYLTPYFSFVQRLIFANLWLTAPLVTRVLAMKQQTATLVRTTTACTIFQAGTKMNTLSSTGRAVVNHRIHPDESVGSTIARDAAVIGDARIKLTPSGAVEPSPTSDDKSPSFEIVASTVSKLFTGAIAAPAIMPGATDSPWSVDIAEQIYRHCPTELTPPEVAMFHGRNERIEVTNLARIACFYAKVLLEADKDRRF